MENSREQKNLIEMKPTVGFKLPSAGVTPAPSERKDAGRSLP